MHAPNFTKSLPPVLWLLRMRAVEEAFSIIVRVYHMVGAAGNRDRETWSDIEPNRSGNNDPRNNGVFSIRRSYCIIRHSQLPSRLSFAYQRRMFSVRRRIRSRKRKQPEKMSPNKLTVERCVKQKLSHSSCILWASSRTEFQQTSFEKITAELDLKGKHLVIGILDEWTNLPRKQNRFRG